MSRITVFIPNVTELHLKTAKMVSFMFYILYYTEEKKNDTKKFKNRESACAKMLERKVDVKCYKPSHLTREKTLLLHWKRTVWENTLEY